MKFSSKLVFCSAASEFSSWNNNNELNLANANNKTCLTAKNYPCTTLKTNAGRRQIYVISNPVIVGSTRNWIERLVNRSGPIAHPIAHPVLLHMHVCRVAFAFNLQANMTRARKATNGAAAAIGRRPARPRELALPYPVRRRTPVDADEASSTPDSLQSRRTSSESLRSDQRSPSALNRAYAQDRDVERRNFESQSPRPSIPASPDGLAPPTHSQLPVPSLRCITVMSPAQDQAENAQPSWAVESSAPTPRPLTPVSPDGPAAPAYQLSPVPPPRGITVMSPPENHAENAQPSQTMEPFAQETRFQLLVRPIVKSTISQRDSSGNTLDDFVTTGDSFNEITHNLWNTFRQHVKQRAIKQGDGWSEEAPDQSAWAKVMQFKLNNHLVDNTKSDQAWNQWLVSSRGKTVKLLIFEYGVAISKAKDLDTFEAACIHPEQTDRAGATAECSLREVADKLKEHWGSSFDTTTIGWRMWANHITRNLNRSTWQEQIGDPPPAHLVHLLRAPRLQVQQRAQGLTKSGEMALDCVEGSLRDNEELQQEVNALGLRLEAQNKLLNSKRNIIQLSSPTLTSWQCLM